MNRFLHTRKIFVAVLLVGWFTLAVRNVVDPDVWWHLKTGEYIAAHKSVPHTDIFSYTRAGQPWIAHEWLSDLLIYGVYRAASWGGLIATFAAIVSAAFFLLYLRGLASAGGSKSTYISGVVALCGALATVPLWGVRPQIISLLFTSLWLFVLERSEQNRGLLWWTLPLTVLWVNLHAGFALGIALLALFLGGEFLEWLLALSAARQSMQHLRALAITLVCDLLLVPLNPNGTEMYLYPIETLRSQAMQKYILEWASPNFHRVEYAPFLFLLLAMIAMLAWSRSCTRPRDLLLLVVSTLAALSSTRMIPFFVLIAVPMLSRGLQSGLGGTRSNFASTGTEGEPARPRTLAQFLNAAIFAAMLAFAAVHLVQVIRQQPQAEASHFPAAAVAYLDAHPTPGPIFNHYDWGGYLIWRLYPRACVFIDGRADVYGGRFLDQFANTYQLTNNWRQTLAQWQVGTVILPPESALAAALRLEPGWSLRYSDVQAEIFTGPSGVGMSPSSCR